MTNHRAGTRLRAGHGFSTVLPDLDFETYSEAGFVWSGSENKWTSLPGIAASRKGLSVVGAHVYAEHPSTDVLCAAYDLKDGAGERVWLPHMDAPADLLDYIAHGGLIEAWNASFEFLIWREVFHKRFGWPPLPLEQTRCAMAKARAFGLPGKLSEAGRVLGLDVQKDKRGDALIRKFCIPRNPTAKDPRRRILFGEDPEGAREMVEYNVQDIKAEAAVSEVVPDLDENLQALWFVDQRINNRGVHVDAQGVDDCISVLEQAQAKYLPELYALTGGAASSASEVAKIIAWLHGRGLHTDSLDEDSLDLLLEQEHAPDVRRVLEIRALLASGSVKKLYALRYRIAKDGRVHGLFVFHKARTGRYAGDGPQPQNLPGSGPAIYPCACGEYFGAHLSACPYCGALPPKSTGDWGFEKAEWVLGLMRTRSLPFVEAMAGSSLKAIAGCLRGMFCAAPGKVLICSDYRAIEAVVLAAIAGEEWRLEVFRTHGLIYETSASKITGIPLDQFIAHKKATGGHHPMRKKVGKVAELASGYRGWINAWKAFGASEFFADDEIKQHILAWRAASPHIVEFWGGQSRGWGRSKVSEMYGIEGAAISAILAPGQAFEFRGFVFQMSGSALYLRLISGRVLVYHFARLEPNERGEYSIVFDGWNSNSKYGAIGWATLYTHGGKLTENIVQALSFDILANAQVNLDLLGVETTLHVHDENIAETRPGEVDVGSYERVLGDLPAWAAGWPVIAAGGWIGHRYRKD